MCMGVFTGNMSPILSVAAGNYYVAPTHHSTARYGENSPITCVCVCVFAFATATERLAMRQRQQQI